MKGSRESKLGVYQPVKALPLPPSYRWGIFWRFIDRPMYNRLTEEEEYAIYKGYLAGRPANEKDPSETYKDKTVLLGCWYWGYNRTKSHKTIQ